TFDSYDTSFFPTKGFYFNTNYIVYLFSPDNIINEDFKSFSQLYGRLGIAHTLFDNFTLHFLSEAGITIGNNGSVLHDYHLGGINENYINTFTPFYGYDVAELNESAFLRSTLTMRYQVFKNNFVSFTANYGRLNEDLWNKGKIFEDTRSGYAVGYGLNSIIGPLELMYSWNPDNNKEYWHLNLGFWF
ncbi:MAG: BamA/TamA family outer membrane protein, partial [Flavobacteriaceae bacterium]|nr:BamA/TamA family outer membrane protein [Flavobacteriaceae bacterium]